MIIMGTDYDVILGYAIDLKKVSQDERLIRKKRCCKHRETSDPFCSKCGQPMWINQPLRDELDSIWKSDHNLPDTYGGAIIGYGGGIIKYYEEDIYLREHIYAFGLEIYGREYGGIRFPNVEGLLTTLETMKKKVLSIHPLLEPYFENEGTLGIYANLNQ